MNEETKPTTATGREGIDIDDLHLKVVSVTLELSLGMVRQMRKKGVPIEPIFAGQMHAVMEIAMVEFRLTAEEAADLVTDFVEAYRGLDAGYKQRAEIALQ